MHLTRIWIRKPPERSDTLSSGPKNEGRERLEERTSAKGIVLYIGRTEIRSDWIKDRRQREEVIHYEADMLNSPWQSLVSKVGFFGK